MQNVKIDEILGIAPKYIEKLAAAGIVDSDALLAAGQSERECRLVAQRSGISNKLVLRWANMVDLQRLRGVCSDHAELLEAAGIETVGDLRELDPGSLAEQLSEINAERRIVRSAPSTQVVEDWIAQAGTL